MNGPHPSHVTRFSDASTFDTICVNCHHTDVVPGGWGALARPCPCPGEPYKTVEEYEQARKQSYEDYMRGKTNANEA